MLCTVELGVKRVLDQVDTLVSATSKLSSEFQTSLLDKAVKHELVAVPRRQLIRTMSTLQRKLDW